MNRKIIPQIVLKNRTNREKRKEKKKKNTADKFFFFLHFFFFLSLAKYLKTREMKRIVPVLLAVRKQIQEFFFFFLRKEAGVSVFVRENSQTMNNT